ncbi:hypothetical protein JZ751_017918 [Albula glossodonta]|uniref:Uncharacterized protein n=1 Tax=Albula glossodonta TaxID=121402 RepID=A0A8T2PPU2_9TELE|nr:hypothetical protein JZ751_017918 [Albula glossodonta]
MVQQTGAELLICGGKEVRWTILLTSSVALPPEVVTPQDNGNRGDDVGSVLSSLLCLPPSPAFSSPRLASSPSAFGGACLPSSCMVTPFSSPGG